VTRVGIFGITDGRDAIEAAQIGEVLRRASARMGAVEFVAFGRGTDRASALLRQHVPAGIAVRTLGVVAPETLLAEAVELDALLFVRHHVSAQRSSAMAAVAAGVPIVGYRGAYTSLPVEGWGMRLVPEGDVEALAAALVAVTASDALWQQLHASNLAACASHIAWDHIADRFLDGLQT
jgi:glycosyltransferase involved in cell wall biosynthesis